MLVWYIFSVTLVHFGFGYFTENNVCKNFSDYATIGFNKNCWYNPDVFSSEMLIAKRYGYPIKKYKVTSEDGYIIALYRIPHNNTDLNTKRQPVLLHHGIGGQALFWMLKQQNSLAFFLVNNGYDVWMATARGSGQSRQHKYLTTDDPMYWNFSFHEMGVCDLPALVEFIANTTGQKGNIIYIGHSMGTTMSYVYASEKKDHASAHLKALISLAPVAYMEYVSPLLKTSFLPFLVLERHLIKAGIYATGNSRAFQQIFYKICSTHPSIVPCFMAMAIATGLSEDQEELPVFVSYFPSSISLKTLHHYIQIVTSRGRFQHFDYGLDNRRYYNSSLPPIYDLTEITLPVHLFVGQEDVLATEKDTAKLYNKLNPPEGRR
ncbi:hypothetical protein NQ317_000961 [Molorchus minor]|uniref:Lipase n=1 Tax=Molorchus minor TaxID=1323400 RepID=A0ABQ9IVW4_9CUCU|nr:hypothetical protein NQ317_000961 [Molorchus minor]